jgi:cobalt-zinc-cadmium efflux system outer membrane protein
MLLGVFDLLRARQDEFDAKREQVEAIRDYWVAYSQLERAVGGRISTAAPSTQPASAPSIDQQHNHHGD